MACTPSAAHAGYIRVPRTYMHLPVSPAAKSLLIHLCGAANDLGESWYSYRQLGEIMQRSRAAVSGYVEELRGTGVIETETQTTANGFNYRLRIRIAGWADLLAQWKLRTVKPAAARTPALATRSNERRIRPTERTDPTGLSNKIHKTDSHCTRQTNEQVFDLSNPAQTGGESGPDQDLSASGDSDPHQLIAELAGRQRAIPAGDPILGSGAIKHSSGPDEIVSDPRPAGPAIGTADTLDTIANIDVNEVWSAAQDAAWTACETDPRSWPPRFRHEPDDGLLRAATAAADHLRRQTAHANGKSAAEASREALDAFMAQYGLDAPREGLGATAAALARHACTKVALDNAMRLLRESWQPHWRRLSGPVQIDKLCREALGLDPCALGDHSALARAVRREYLALRTLKDRARRAVRTAQPAGPAASGSGSVSDGGSRSRRSEVSAMLAEFLGARLPGASVDHVGEGARRQRDIGDAQVKAVAGKDDPSAAAGSGGGKGESREAGALDIDLCQRPRHNALGAAARHKGVQSLVGDGAVNHLGDDAQHQALALQSEGIVGLWVAAHGLGHAGLHVRPQRRKVHVAGNGIGITRNEREVGRSDIDGERGTERENQGPCPERSVLQSHLAFHSFSRSSMYVVQDWLGARDEKADVWRSHPPNIVDLSPELTDRWHEQAQTAPQEGQQDRIR